jgi:uncharacterized membrane protein ArfC
MNDVNWWLMALAFVLGLALTLAFMVRRVVREVPVYAEGTAGVARAAKLVGSRGDGDGAGDEEPYGAGSLRLATGSADAPAGYPIKGNGDSMLYHTPGSPSYEATIAELWFRDAATAEAAGFNRWDSGKSQRGRD